MLTMMENRDADADASMIERLEALACRAGQAIMEVYREGAEVRSKADHTPVTIADERAEAIILKGLRSAYPDMACVSEEEISAGIGPTSTGRRFFLIDPLDGTREFISKRPEFTVNIALVEEGQPILGVVYAPAAGVVYSGRPGRATRASVDERFEAHGHEEIAASPPADPVRILCSRSHMTPETQAFLDRHANAVTCSIGSSLKFCKVAEGGADLYPRFGRTMEWDTAAGDAVLRAAGGSTLRLDGSPLSYGKRDEAGNSDYANPHFVASGRERPVR